MKTTNMKALLLTGAAALSTVMATAQFNPLQHTDRYHVEVDIRDMSDDELSITVVPPVMNEDTVVYAMPKIIPGTYSISDFGQFLRNVQAFDSRGKELEVEQLDDNRWAIYNGKALYKITYDAVDTEEEYDAHIFLPGGTAIKEDGVMLNLYGFVGFMDGFGKMTYELEVRKSGGLLPTSTLDIISEGEDRDVFEAQDYFQLHDCPVLYSALPNASVMVAGAEVTVGVYSPSGNLSAEELLETVKPIFTATESYLGGELPTDRYAVLIWARSMEDMSRDGSAGALEHFTSTTLVMPDSKNYYEMVRHVTAHEFFHIITPLNIHSEQIHDYDFMNPQMSAHLWFYEGVTEYNSLISQVRGGIMSEADFLDEMKSKMRGADQFNEHIPMTVRSQHALDLFADQYYDVYQKGALIGMALDMFLRQETDGEMGLVDLQIKLKNIYGPDTFFVDNDFFDIISENTPEGTEEFLYEYIAGTRSLPLEELFDAVGYSYVESKPEYYLATPDWNLTFLKSRSKYYIVSNFNADDEFTGAFGLQKGDRLKRWNGDKVKGGELNEVLTEWKEEAVLGDVVEIEVIRTNESGDEETITLTSEVTAQEDEHRHILKEKANPSEAEIQLRKAWLNL